MYRERGMSNLLSKSWLSPTFQFRWLIGNGRHGAHREFGDGRTSLDKCQVARPDEVATTLGSR